MTETAGLRHPQRYVYILTALLGAGSIGLALQSGSPLSSRFDSYWWILIVIGIGYTLCEKFSFIVEFRREEMSFTMSEVPTIFALAFLGPIPAILVRTFAYMAVRSPGSRTAPIKLAFNTGLFAFETALCFFLIHLVLGDGTSPGTFLVAAAFTMTLTTIVGVVLVWVVISFMEGNLLERIKSEITSSALIAMIGALVGVLAVSPALFGLQYGVLALIPVASAWHVLQKHGELHHDLRKLTDVHAFTGVLGESIDLSQVAPSALAEICRLTRAGRVTLRLDADLADADSRLWSVGDPIDSNDVEMVMTDQTPDPAQTHASFAVPVLLDGEILGQLLLADHYLGLDFGSGDIELATDLADQFAVSIRNGLLHASLEHAALRDPLTGDANRTAFEQRLMAMLGRRRRGVLAVMMLDLNRFKEVNDTLGHHVGDQVLLEFSRRVREVLTNDDTVARFGGDEFALLLRRDNFDEVRAVAEAVLSRSHQPMQLDGCAAVVTASIGISVIGENETDASGVLRRADIAMYAAKNERVGIEVYRDEIDRRTPARLSLLGDLRTSIENNEIDVHFQPKIDLATSTVIGAEALVRWTHPERGFVPPDEFIGVAEESGLIRLITDLVLGKAIRRAKEWRDHGYDLNVAVNLSALDLHDDQLASRIAHQLSINGLEPSQLTLEITESSLMVDSVRTMGTIESLDLLGVRLSLDDFGTGYSSLSYLRKLPVYELKIDRSFVSELLVNASDDVIVRSTVDLGHNLGLRVVAEGIENAQVQEHLAALGCDIGQGYGIARPLAPEQFSQWLETTHHPVARIASLAPPVPVAGF
ncbi:MAG: putative bifunctional diguanylate cyclase/phosphodiesterase [Ilumatobacter sp.]